MSIIHEFSHDRIDNEIYYSDLSHKLITYYFISASNLTAHHAGKVTIMEKDFLYIHYIKFLLAFKPLLDIHLGEKLANYIMKTLHFHNIMK